jgi:putative transposase
MTAVEVFRINGVSEQASYRWKRRYGEMRVSEGWRLRRLEAEIARLKRLLTELDPEIGTIRDVLRGNHGRTGEAAHGADARRARSTT